MENASKALIISGAVLVTILILTTGIYVVNTQKPELFAKNTSDKMWSGIDLGLGLQGKAEYENMGENVEINTEGGNEKSTTYLKSGALFSHNDADYKIGSWWVEELTFIDTNRYKPKDAVIKKVDVGEIRNGEIMAYVYDNDGNGLYEVVVGQAGGVKANPNSSLFLQGSENIKKINFKYLDTSKVTDMSRMFFNCRSLTSLDVSNFNTANVTNMSEMFDQCYSLVELDLSYLNTSNVTDMSYMFKHCENLISLEVSGWNISKVIDMNCMFIYCEKLTNLDLSKWDTSNVSDMSGMFFECEKLTSLDLSKWNTSDVSNMACMFYECEKLTSLDLSKWNTSNVTDMHDMFYRCISLTNLDVSNFSTLKVTNMARIFKNCAKLTSLDLSKWNTSNVINMREMFSYCKRLEELILGENFIIQSLTNTYYITCAETHDNTVAAINAKLPVTE